MGSVWRVGLLSWWLTAFSFCCLFSILISFDLLILLTFFLMSTMLLARILTLKRGDLLVFLALEVEVGLLTSREWQAPPPLCPAQPSRLHGLLCVNLGLCGEVDFLTIFAFLAPFALSLAACRLK